MSPDTPALRAVIVDDEAPARNLLREYLGADPGIAVVAECANGFEAVKRIGELSPDLVFLDVQMPKLDGFEVLELIGPGPAVVFVTAYDEYALKAFEVHAVDYLLKPFARERLVEALARVRVRIAAAPGRRGSSLQPAPGRSEHAPAPDAEAIEEPSAVARLTAAARPPGQFVERLLVKDGANVHVIPVDTIDYLEAQDDYVAIHAGGKSHLKAGTLSDISAGLDPDRFVRIHRSYVLNIERIGKLELYAKDSRMVTLKNGNELPVSRAGYSRLKELL
jgi:two-component system LytT family response regulator